MYLTLASWSVYVWLLPETPRHQSTFEFCILIGISPVTSYVICSIIQSLNFVIANSSDCLIKAAPTTQKPKIICIDELDKMPSQFQEKLLNFMESGYIKVDQIRKQYDFKIKGAKVFAACNEITRLSRPLQSRFRCLHLPSYTEEQFLEVAVKVLPRLKIAHVIGKAVWRQRGDIRDVISIGKLVRKNDGPEEVEQILSTMTKYGEIKEH